MIGNGGESTGFEVGIVVPKKKEWNFSRVRGFHCVDSMVMELEKVGLMVERIQGISDEFIKIAAPVETMGRAAAKLQLKKMTSIGMDLQFEWDEREAFVRQPDGSLFSWCERLSCFHHIIYGIVNKKRSKATMWLDGKEFLWYPNESLLKRMESEGIIKLIFPLHDETNRKHLLRNWAFNWLDFTWQPIDEIYSYFGTKIATYFSFLGMYTRWLFFPASFGLAVHLFDFGSGQIFVLPVFFVFVISWAVFFFQFWKRKNSVLLARWGINDTFDSVREKKDRGKEMFNKIPVGEEKSMLQREEWFGHLLKIRNDAIVVFGIICLQLPFELTYAHLYENTDSYVIKYGLVAVYLLAIQYYTRFGAKVSIMLIKSEKNAGRESSADSLVYKVFGLYFMQTYIGLFYHALQHRNIVTLREVLIQRLIVSQVLENLLENSVPYIKYSYKKYKALRNKRYEKGQIFKLAQLNSRVEKEFLKPSYSASIGAELEDGLFDDFLELALQFGMIMMFACAFPLIFCFTVLNNITEIRVDAFKLLVMFKRPIPRTATTIGAWLNIFQFLIVMSICTNCTLLVCLYDQEGKWKLEPGLAAILIMEHVLLLIKFGFSHFVPEEPAWVKANRVQNVAKAQDLCSKQLLRSISSMKRRRIE
ncbi:Anoctamin-like protein [Zostera marina]|uniref:Anoctamin-like protein n=1 Tax=Zostera marina TaxID=29655 RepID=A0A0K9NQD1_ZOSMR|nr:Anoctamin-like protein [Zostera marina]